MTTSTSNIVETINIDYEDFNESFLTCSTCLYAFDTDLHRPKLLSCSHTVCKTCLERIAEQPQSQDTGSFRCPICRETIAVPRAGVQSLPPSFVINQLIDLMSRQRRDLVPKCATHASEELLFCETCGVVFCSSCSSSTATPTTAAISIDAVSSNNAMSPTSQSSTTVVAPPSSTINVNPRHHRASQCLNHNVVPFSIAIKRISEILLYKAGQCTKNLNKAAENVRKEMEQLDSNADRVVDLVNSSFQDLNKCVERRRQELIDSVRRTRDSKRKILQEQLGIIHSEKAKVEQECSGLHTQLLDVRHISRRVDELNQKLDASGHLIEPRENSFLHYDADSSGFVMDGLSKVLSEFGSLRISKTFPPLCTLKTETQPVLNVQCQVTLLTVDYEGQPRMSGGDPVRAQVVSIDPGADPPNQLVPHQVRDVGDGTYKILYTPTRPGEHLVEVNIFDRLVKGCPLRLTVEAHNNPVTLIGALSKNRAVDPEEPMAFSQPVRVASGPDGRLLVLDTGYNRVKIFDEPKSPSDEHKLYKTIVGEPLAFQSTVGLALTPQRTFVTLNWRTKCVTEWSMDATSFGIELKSFTFSEFIEPLDVAVDSEGRVLVCDNGAKKVFVFDHNARPLFSFIVKSSLELNASAAANVGGSLRRRRSSNDDKTNTSLDDRPPPIVNPGSLTIGATTGKPLSSTTAPNFRHSTTGYPVLQLTCISVGPKDDIVVGGSEIQIYDHCGRYVCNLVPNLTPSSSLKNLPAPHSYFVGGLAVDQDGFVLSTINDPKAAYVNVCRYGGPKGAVSTPNCYVIDSSSLKLRRPSGLCIASDGAGFCYVADLGNNCIKKYRYK